MTATRTTQAARIDRAGVELNIGELVPGLLNHDGQPIVKCRVMVNTVKRLASAAASAHAHVEASAPAAPAAHHNFVRDPDVLANAKSVSALYEAFREYDDPKYPLFPTVEWMRDNLTPSAVAVLTNAYCEAEKAEGPVIWSEITGESIDSIVDTCARNVDTPIPEALLMRYEREWLTQFIVVAAYAWQQERRRVLDVLSRDGGEMAAQLADDLRVKLRLEDD